MRRAYVLAIAAISVYCLTDAFASSGGGQADRSGRPVFSAEIVDAPIVSLGNAVGPVLAATSPEGTNAAADPVAEAETPTVHPAAAVSVTAPKPRALASAAPRR